MERRMEDYLYDRFGHLGLGEAHGRDLPVIGAVHLAAGFMLSEMLGCQVNYRAGDSPEVIPAGIENLEVNVEAAFASARFKRFVAMVEALRADYGCLLGDVNWGGVLNIAIDLRGQDLFMDFLDRPDEVETFFCQIAAVIERFVLLMRGWTGSSSVSVTRLVRHLSKPVALHSECSNTMISEDDYRRFLLPIDKAWGRTLAPFGIHHCGKDPGRLAGAYAEVPGLAYFDLGWGGDVSAIRLAMPDAFLGLRLNPVDVVKQAPEEIRADILRLASDAGGPHNAGVVCVNLDATATDEQVAAIFNTAAEIRLKG